MLMRGNLAQAEELSFISAALGRKENRNPGCRLQQGRAGGLGGVVPAPRCTQRGQETKRGKAMPASKRSSRWWSSDKCLDCQHKSCGGIPPA